MGKRNREGKCWGRHNEEAEGHRCLAKIMVGLDDPEGLFQPSRFCISVTVLSLAPIPQFLPRIRVPCSFAPSLDVMPRAFEKNCHF